jgi:hypothetical protein
MGGILTLFVIVYLVGMGVVLAPTVQGNEITARHPNFSEASYRSCRWPLLAGGPLSPHDRSRHPGRACFDQIARRALPACLRQPFDHVAVAAVPGSIAGPTNRLAASVVNLRRLRVRGVSNGSGSRRREGHSDSRRHHSGSRRDTRSRRDTHSRHDSHTHHRLARPPRRTHSHSGDSPRMALDESQCRSPQRPT